MLSYRHAYHAGNHADVLKHLILLQIAHYMGEKAAPFWIIDTHAGAGCYTLDAPHAMKLAEWQEGIGRLWQASGLPPAAADYLDFVRMLNPDGALKHYPGSPGWRASVCATATACACSSCTAAMPGSCVKTSARPVAR